MVIGHVIQYRPIYLYAQTSTENWINSHADSRQLEAVRLRATRNRSAFSLIQLFFLLQYTKLSPLLFLHDFPINTNCLRGIMPFREQLKVHAFILIIVAGITVFEQRLQFLFARQITFPIAHLCPNVFDQFVSIATVPSLNIKRKADFKQKSLNGSFKEILFEN